MVGQLRIIFKPFGPIRRALGKRIIEVDVVDSTTVRQVIDRVVGQSSDNLKRLVYEGEEINRNLIVLLNKRDVNTLEMGLDTVVSEGDEVALLPHVQGG
ncbi:MAG: hypothetical protein DRP09_01030 [Candidatus Thorarchaeota archaeon]|nr:MAG: hypothetical protein DRP09_01030 [Candidatus Thorarchaeota archaeon]